MKHLFFAMLFWCPFLHIVTFLFFCFVIQVICQKAIHQNVHLCYGMKTMKRSRKHGKEKEQNIEKKIVDRNIRSFLLQNLYLDENKNYNWKINLESLKKNIENIKLFPKTQNSFKGNTLFIKGKNSQSKSIFKQRIYKKNSIKLREL